MSDVDVDGLRAAAEAVELEADWYEPTAYIDTRNPQDVGFIAAASPDVVLALLDRLAAAESRADYWHKRMEAAWEREDWAANVALMHDCAATLQAAQEATGADLSASEPICDHPGIDHDVVWSYCRPCPKCGVCKFIGHGPLCFDCYSASGAESDHGDRREGEGLACACRGMDEKPGCNHDREERP